MRPPVRVPFNVRLWQPAPYLGSETREERSRLADFLALRAEREKPSLAVVSLQQREIRPGYIADLRRRIEGKPKPEAVDIRQRYAVAEKR